MQNNESKSSSFSIVKLLTYPFIGLFFVMYLLINFPFKLIKYSFLGILYIIYSIFKMFKYVTLGISYILYNIFSIFKIAKKDSKKSNSKKEEILEKKKNSTKKINNKKKIEEKKNKAIEKKNKAIEKKNKAIEKKNKAESEVNNILYNFIDSKKQDKEYLSKMAKRKKLDSEAYINKNVKLEKPTLKSKLKESFGGVGTFFGSKINKIKNNTFSKNRRNKKDMQRETLLIDFEGEDAIKSEKKVLYEYVAKDITGRVVKDYFDAYSKVEVHSYLLSEGYEVYSIKTNKLIQLLHSGTSTNKTKIKNKDLIFFLTQLSTYIKAGIPLVESLRIVARQYKNKKYQKIFRSVIYELTVGENFSTAMEKQDVAFPKLLINMVKTAEMTGSLPEVLDDMANYYTETEASRKQMITAMTYPTLVFVFAIGVMIFVMVFVVPQFVEIYDSMDTGLPGITKAILSISAFLKKYWYFLVLGIGILIWLFIYSYKKIKFFRTMCQWGIMKLPIFKNVIIYNEVTMFTKTFSSLLSHNVPITDCMEILNKITNNEIYKMLILDTLTNLAKGGKISDAFKDHWAFPVPAYEMIVTGEATGELSEMMGKVSMYYQDLHKNAVTRIKAFVEPALTVFLTIGVGIIILSIIIPMFSMYSAVQEMG